MIDLSFLTDAEQEAILQVLQRDAELKKTEDQRIRNLQSAVHDENELKYKSGQWFYDAKSRRHRDKIHGADLVRASIRKRKKPSTIAELGEMNKGRSKKLWVNSVNQDMFIPPELYGVMEVPDESEEDILPDNPKSVQSSKKVDFLSPEKDKDSLTNGMASPAKIRKNPFNSEDVDDVPDLHVKNGQVNGNEDLKPDPMYAVVKKPTSSTPEQELDMDDALMEQRFLGQRWKNVNNYQPETPLEFGKSYGGFGKINYGSRSSKRSPEEHSISARDVLFTPESVEGSYHDQEDMSQLDDGQLEPIPGWRKPYILENQEPISMPSTEISWRKKTAIDTPQEITEVNYKVERDAPVKLCPEIQNSPTYSSGDYKEETRSTFTLPGFDKPVEANVRVPEVVLQENKGRKDLPKSANFKVMTLKDRLDMPKEQMPNPSQFQSLKHFWNAEEKTLPKGEVSTSPNRILTDIFNRNKPTRADLKQRNSKGVPADDLILPNAFDKLSEDEQTSQKVTSWLAQTPTVYGVEHIDHSEEPLYSGEEIVEHIQKSSSNKKSSSEDFTSAPQNLREEALEVPNTAEAEKLRTEEIQALPEEKLDVGFFPQKTITVSPNSLNSIENRTPTNRGLYDRVVELSNKQSPDKMANTSRQNIQSIPVSEQNTVKPVEETIEKTMAPEKIENQFNIGFQKLKEEDESFSVKPGDGGDAEVSNLPSKNLFEEDANETKEVIEKSTAPQRDQQDFDSSLKKLEIEASTKPILQGEIYENQDNLPGEEITLNTTSPVKSSYKIGFEHFYSTEGPNKVESPTVQHSAVYPAEQSVPADQDNEDLNAVNETVEKTTVSQKDDEELRYALQKLELEALETPSIDESVSSAKQNVSFEKPECTIKLETDTCAAPSTNLNQSTPILKNEEPTIDLKEMPPVEEPPIERAIVETHENSADFHNRLVRLQEEAAIDYKDQPDLSADDSIKVSQFPSREVVVSKKVYSSIESMPMDDTNQHEKAKDAVDTMSALQSKLKKLEEQKPPGYPTDKPRAKYSRSPNQSGSSTGSARIVLSKKPDSSPQVSNSNQGMDDPNLILNALKRSTAKTLNKAVEEVSPTRTTEAKLNGKDDVSENSFPKSADKFKQLSQSVPAFLQDEAESLTVDIVQTLSPTDGRETDSASESSFRIGRHRKSPSSLTNLSGSSGMASMSSVSGSVMSVYSGDFGNVDVKGGIELSLEYVEKLNELNIYIYQCRDLAMADVKKQRSDPYVKTYLLPEKAKMGKRKSTVKKKTLNPVYNEILKYKIPKQALLTQTLNASVWHHDALGRNSFLGEVNINLGTWDWNTSQRNWYQLEPRTPAAGIGLENRGEMKLSLKYVPLSPVATGTKPIQTGEVHIWIKDCLQLPMLRDNKINSFVKCTILPDTSRKSRQKTRTVDKTPNPFFNHTMVYDGFKEDDLREACVELTVWDHNRLSNHFLGGLRLGLGTGKSYGTAVDWMDSSHEESTMWEKMISSPNTWIDGMLPLRMFKMAKLAK